MTTLWQDIHYGLRMLGKRPGFTAVAALSLALGIGANTIIFSLIHNTLLRPLNYPDPDKLVVVWQVPQKHKDQRNTLTVSAYFDFRDHNQSFTALGAFNGMPHNLGAEQNGEPAERVNAQTFTPAMFAAIGVKPMMGRTYTDAEDQVGNAAPVAVISYRLWQGHFNGDPNIVGKTILLDKNPTAVIGVMPRDFTFFGDNTDLWEPIQISRTMVLSKSGFLVTVARLKPGVTIQKAQAEMDALAAQLAASDPERNQGTGAVVQTLQEAAYGDLRSPLLILQGAVAFVLLIGCANVAGLKAFIASAPPNFPRLHELSLDLPALGFTALIVILTSVIFGVVPALQVSKPDLVNTLKEYGRSGTDSVARQHLRSALVTLQIALALVLLIGAGLMINSFVRVERADLGADPKGLLTFEFRFTQDETIKPFARYRGMGLWDVNPLTTVGYTRVFERMQSLPGVVSAAGISRAPLSGQGISMPFLIEGHPAPPPSSASGDSSEEQGQNADYFAVTPNFFATMRIPILRGRDFNAQDNNAAPQVIIITQTLARRFFANENPLGKRITLDFVPDEKPRQIIGVVGDTVNDRFQKKQRPVMYVPYTQQTPRWIGPFWNDRAAMVFVLRSLGDPAKLTPSVRRAVSEVDPNKPAANFRTVEENLDRQVQYIRTYILLLGIFGGIAAVLAAIGIYGVMAYSVAERTREIGIRMALGAGGRDVLTLIARQALLLISIGLALGLGASFALTRLVKSALVGVTATDPATYASVSVALAVVAMLACFIPTRRAVAVDPTVALRYE